MKKILLSLFVAMVATLGAQAQKNLLENGGFEQWDNDTQPTAWKSASSASKSKLKKSSDAHSGATSVEIQSGFSNQRLACTEIVLEAGTYDIEFFAKSSSATLSIACGYVEVDEKNEIDSNTYQYAKNSQDKTNYISGLTEWTKIEHRFDLAKKTRLCLLVLVSKHRSTPQPTVLIDDFKLTKQEDPASVQTLASENAQQVAFDLAGRRVSPEQKGIVVVNGVKRVNR